MMDESFIGSKFNFLSRLKGNLSFSGLLFWVAKVAFSKWLYLHI